MATRKPSKVKRLHRNATITRWLLPNGIWSTVPFPLDRCHGVEIDGVQFYTTMPAGRTTR